MTLSMEIYMFSKFLSDIRDYDYSSHYIIEFSLIASYTHAKIIGLVELIP
jgi:hypothetical protein